MASRKSLHNLNSALRSSQDMPHLRVLSASLSSSFVSAASNSISSIGASGRAALSEELTMIFSLHFQAEDCESSCKARRARLWAAMRLFLIRAQAGAAWRALPRRAGLEGEPGSRKAAAFAGRSRWKASVQRGPEPGGRRGERMFLASRKSLHKPNSVLRSSQDMPHLRVLSSRLSSPLVSAVSNSISSVGESHRIALSGALSMISGPSFHA